MGLGDVFVKSIVREVGSNYCQSRTDIVNVY